MERRPLIIVGSGPAGSASALFLQARDPALARETLVLEKARHPRRKVCAGGLIPQTLNCLRELKIPLSVPNAVVHRGRVEIPGQVVKYEARDLCRVVRRDAFDDSLVRTCEARGIEVRQEEKVLTLRRVSDGVRIETDRGDYHARMVIGADGSGSLVRRSLVPGGRQCVGRAIMTDVPVHEVRWDGFADERYEFSFVDVARGLRGYSWAFPCLVDGVPHVNVGVYAINATGTGRLLADVLRAHLDRIGASSRPIQSFPIRWYGRGVRIAAPRVLLTGDAAGAEALMGEGISFAFEYARRAAAVASRALVTGEYDFVQYERDVAQSWVGRKLRRLEFGTRMFYGPTWRVWFSLAARSRVGQEISVRWYNGVDGWDRRRAWEAVWAWMRGRVRPTDAEAPEA